MKTDRLINDFAGLPVTTQILLFAFAVLILFIFQDFFTRHLPGLILVLFKKKKLEDVFRTENRYMKAQKAVYSFPSNFVVADEGLFRREILLIIEKHRRKNESLVLVLAEIEIFNESFLKIIKEIIDNIVKLNNVNVDMVFPKNENLADLYSWTGDKLKQSGSKSLRIKRNGETDYRKMYE